MATKLFSTLPDLRSVPGAGESNPARLNIPSVGRILNIKGAVTRMNSGGTAYEPASLADMRSYIGDVWFMLGAETIRKWRFAEYLAVLQLNGYPITAGLFPYFFAEPWRAQVWDEEMVSLQVGGRYPSVSLNFDVEQPASKPLFFNFSYEYDMMPKVNRDGTPVFGILGHTLQVENPGAGEPIIPLNRFAGALQRLHIVIPSSANITRIRLLQNEAVIYDRHNTAARPEIAWSLQDMGLRLPDNFTIGSNTYKMVPLVLDNNQRITNNISDTTGLALQLSLDSAVQIRLLIEQHLSR
jgi:hypothetical protein